YETFYKALSKGELAYGSSIDELLKNMSESSRKYLEIDMWHGQSLSGIGVVSAVDGGAEKFTISKATWAPGNWVGAEGMVVQAFFQTVTPLDTMRSGDMVVTGVDPENRVITVNSKAGSLGQNDVILVKSQRDVSGTPAWNSMLGLLALAGTTT